MLLGSNSHVAFIAQSVGQPTWNFFSTTFPSLGLQLLIAGWFQCCCLSALKINAALFKSSKSLESILLLMSICDTSAKIMSINEATDIVLQIRNSSCRNTLTLSKGLQISNFVLFFFSYSVLISNGWSETDILNSGLLSFFFTLFKFFKYRLCLHRALAKIIYIRYNFQ